MSSRARNEEYATVPKTLHWVTVGFVAIAWALGILGDELPKGAMRDTGLLVHISIGLAILAIALVRIPWRVASPPPPIEPTRWGKWLIEWTDPVSRITHYALYVLLVAVPFVGIALQFARGHSLPLFGLMDIPSPWTADKAFARNIREVHEVLAHVLVILALFHMTAALIHHWVFGDRTLKRMLPHFRKQM
jgi:cytochrome b561